MIRILVLIMFCLCVSFLTPVHAQESEPTFTRSLFFTDGEIAELRAAMNGARFVRSAEDTADLELLDGVDLLPLDANGEAIAALPPEPAAAREVILGGLVYITSNNWTIWLNGQRITPGNLPDEVVNLRVFQNYVEVKWFDRTTKTIYDITLKPHQKYNIDQDKLLPS